MLVSFKLKAFIVIIALAMSVGGLMMYSPETMKAILEWAWNFWAGIV